MEWISDHAALAWLAAALILGVLELLSLDFFFTMLAGGALAGSVASAVGADGTVSVVVAAVVCVALLVVVRPLLVARVQRQPHRQTGTAALIGRDAEVTETVTRDGGRAKLAGEIWSARTDDRDPLTPGLRATVVRIEGATVVLTVQDAPVEKENL